MKDSRTKNHKENVSSFLLLAELSMECFKDKKKHVPSYTMQTVHTLSVSMDPQNGPPQFMNACRKMCPVSFNENKYLLADPSTAEENKSHFQHASPCSCLSTSRQT